MVNTTRDESRVRTISMEQALVRLESTTHTLENVREAVLEGYATVMVAELVREYDASESRQDFAYWLQNEMRGPYHFNKSRTQDVSERVAKMRKLLRLRAEDGGVVANHFTKALRAVGVRSVEAYEVTGTTMIRFRRT